MSNQPQVRLVDRLCDLPVFGAAQTPLPSSRIYGISKLPVDKAMALARATSEKEIAEYREAMNQWIKDPSAGFAKQLREKINAAGVVIVADEVAEWFFEHHDAKDIGYSDVPNATPPFPRFWVEAKTPLNMQVGIFCEAEDLRKVGSTKADPRERWRITATTLSLFSQGADLYAKPSIVFTVGEDGRIVQPPVANENGGRPVDLAEHCWIGILLSAVSFIHCKNISLVPGDIPKQLDKARIKRGKPPLVRFRTLRIDGMKKILRTEGRSGESGIKHALHICRGHFRTYSPDRPLFGRVVGTVWVPQHSRGNAERGVVVKDYQVSAHQSEAMTEKAGVS